MAYKVDDRPLTFFQWARSHKFNIVIALIWASMAAMIAYGVVSIANEPTRAERCETLGIELGETTRYVEVAKECYLFSDREWKVIDV